MSSTNGTGKVILHTQNQPTANDWKPWKPKNILTSIQMVYIL